jgi:CHRD domain-containing protein
MESGTKLRAEHSDVRRGSARDNHTEENTMQRTIWRGAAVGALAMLALSGCGMVGDQRAAGMGGQVVTLEGLNEVPPVTTTAVGTANVTVHHDRTVVVKVIVSGLTPTASHIHEGAPGTNGPVAVPFTKLGDNEFVSSPGARLTEAQYEAYKKGNLYVNVHSAKHSGGEIRGQIRAP